MNTQEITLYQIDQELAALIAYREERTTDTAEPPSEEELQALDGEIAKYMEALPAKVDNVAAIFRLWKSQREAAKTERDRIDGIIKRLDANETRLKGYVQSILERQPEPVKGCRKLVGREGSQLMLKGNGGVQPLEITNEKLIPRDCMKATVVMPADEWDGMREHFLDIGMTLMDERVEIDSKAIREAIADTGGVPGAYLRERGVHVEVR